MSNYHGYPPEERPAVHVLHDDGCWYLGRLCAWQRHDEAWHAVVEYAVRVGSNLYLDLPADRVRQADPAREALNGARIPPDPDDAPGWG